MRRFDRASGLLWTDLSEEEIRLVESINAERMRNAKNGGARTRILPGTWEDSDEEWSRRGVIAEVGLCALYELPWRAFDQSLRRRSEPDVYGVDVKMTKHGAGMLLLPEDHPNDRAVALVIHLGNGRVGTPGWIYAHEAKRPEWWSDGSGKFRLPTFAVPQSALLDPAWLPIRETEPREVVR